MFIMAKPSDQLFVIKSDKLQEFLAIKPDKDADAAARERVENFKKICRKNPNAIITMEEAESMTAHSYKNTDKLMKAHEE